MLFLKYLDDLEHEKAMQAELKGNPYEYIIDEDHRWSTWADAGLGAFPKLFLFK